MHRAGSHFPIPSSLYDRYLAIWMSALGLLESATLNLIRFSGRDPVDPLPTATIDSLPVAQFVAGQEPFVAFGNVPFAGAPNQAQQSFKL